MIVNIMFVSVCIVGAGKLWQVAQSKEYHE